MLIFEILIMHKLSLGSCEVRPDRFSRVDVFWIQTNKQTPKQTPRQAKYKYRLYQLFLIKFQQIFTEVNLQNFIRENRNITDLDFNHFFRKWVWAISTLRVLCPLTFYISDCGLSLEVTSEFMQQSQDWNGRFFLVFPGSISKFYFLKRTIEVQWKRESSQKLVLLFS